MNLNYAAVGSAQVQSRECIPRIPLGGTESSSKRPRRFCSGAHRLELVDTPDLILFEQGLYSRHPVQWTPFSHIRHSR